MKSSVRSAHRQLRNLYPDDGDLGTFVGNVAKKRGVSIALQATPDLPVAGVSGILGVGKHTGQYWILYPQHAAPARQQHIVCHEIAHLMLGHAGDHEVDDAALLLRDLLPDLSPDLIRSVLQRCNGTRFCDQEQEAEELATVLAIELSRRAEVLDHVQARFS